MSPTILAGLLLLSQFALLGTVLYRRYLGNRALFKTDRALTPIRTKNRFFGGFTGLFDRLDRIPLLRRSGTANEFDLLKAMTLVTVPYFIFELVIHRPSLLIALLASNILLLLVNAIVVAHPLLKGAVGRRGR